MTCEACGGELFYTRSAKIEMTRIYEAGYTVDKVHICNRCLRRVLGVLKIAY